MPARIELAVAGDDDLLGTARQLGDLVQRALHLVLGADDAHVVLHRGLQRFLHLIRPLGSRAAPERCEGARRGLVHLALIHGSRPVVAGEACGVLARALAEDEEIGQRVAAEPIGAMEAGGAFAAGEQAGKGGHLGVSIHADAAHDVVRGGPDLHRLLRDVDAGELHELVVHARQLLPDVLRRVRDLLLDPRDVEVDAAMR